MTHLKQVFFRTKMDFKKKEESEEESEESEEESEEKKLEKVKDDFKNLSNILRINQRVLTMIYLKIILIL